MKSIIVLISRDCVLSSQTIFEISIEEKSNKESHKCEDEKNFMIEILVDDEEILWNSYEMAPGGAILLKDTNKMMSDK